MQYPSHPWLGSRACQWLALIVPLALAPACGGTPTAPVRIRVGYLPMVSSLTYFVAVENQYFIDEDLEIQATPIKTSNMIAQDLTTGGIDAAIELSIVPLLNTIGDKAPRFRIFSVSSITEANGFDGVLVKEDSPATRLVDLSGQRVAVFPGSTAAATFKSVFARLFPGTALPQLVQIDPSLHLQSLARGDVAAVHAYEPTLTIGLVEKHYRRLAGSIYAMQLSPSPIGVAAINAEWYATNKQGAEALFRALDRAVHFIDVSPDEARRILAKYTGAAPDVARAMHIMPMSPSTRIDTAMLTRYVALLRDMSEISSSVSINSLLLP